jgi:hypothetical protein
MVFRGHVGMKAQPQPFGKWPQNLRVKRGPLQSVGSDGAPIQRSAINQQSYFQRALAAFLAISALWAGVSNFFGSARLPTSFIGRFQLLCSYRARFFGIGETFKVPKRSVVQTSGRRDGPLFPGFDRGNGALPIDGITRSEVIRSIETKADAGPDCRQTQCGNAVVRGPGHAKDCAQVRRNSLDNSNLLR